MSDYLGSEAPDVSPRDKKCDELVVDNLPLVRDIVNKKCSRHLRDDAVQEATMRLLVVAPYHNPEKAKFTTYAGTCVRNKVIDMTKGEQRRLARVRQLRANEDGADLRTPLDVIIQNEEKIFLEQLHKAVQELPLYERYVITFHHGLYNEAPHTLLEISGMLKVPYGTAKTIEQRAYKKLRAALKEECA